MYMTQILYTIHILYIPTLYIYTIYTIKAVGIILAIIAAKLAAETAGIELLSPLQSLAAVVGILGVGVGTSLWVPDQAEAAEVE